jgi:hypothetical protein
MQFLSLTAQAILFTCTLAAPMPNPDPQATSSATSGPNGGFAQACIRGVCKTSGTPPASRNSGGGMFDPMPDISIPDIDIGKLDRLEIKGFNF